MTPSRYRPTSARAPQRSGLLALALALALLAAQTLGLWHRTEHAPASGRIVQVAAPSSGGEHARLTAQVFGHSAHEASQCRLFDQLTIADALHAIAAVLPVFKPVCALVAPHVDRATRNTSAPYQARAPPAFG